MRDLLGDCFGDCGMGSSAETVIDSIAKAAQGTIHAYGETKSDAVSDVVGKSALYVGLVVIGGIAAYQLLKGR